jgi:hypothetical protein
MTAAITAALPAPRTVEVRIPAGPTQTGSTKTWAKHVTGCSRTAKTGHDYAGPWLDDGKLADLPQGALVVVGGSKGSRKNGCKWAGLYCVIDAGCLILVAERQADEWAVQLRDWTCELLELDWVERCKKVLADEIAYLTDPDDVPTPPSKLVTAREARATDFLRLNSEGGVAGWLRVSDGSWFWSDLHITREAHVAEQTASLELLEASWTEAQRARQCRIDRLHQSLDEFEALTGAPAAERPEVSAARAALLALTADERAALLAELS